MVHNNSETLQDGIHEQNPHNPNSLTVKQKKGILDGK